MADAKKTLSHVEFFRLCEEMRNIRETLQDQKPSKNDACKMLQERTKFLVSHHAIEQAMEATGITWTARKISNGASAVEKYQVTRILGNAIIDLYKQFGLDIPIALIGLVERSTGKIVQAGK